jgi:hypothetical protein
MGTPAHTQVRPAPRSIQDLRTLILANASLIKALQRRDNEAPDTRTELVVGANMQPNAFGTQPKHYAMLVRCSDAMNSMGMMVVGKMKPTIEEALESVLENTQFEIDGFVGFLSNLGGGV